MEKLLSCRDVRCRRDNWLGGRPSCLDGVSASFRAGEMCGLAGRDGCGKGLLLNVLGLLEAPDAGAVEVAGRVAGELGVAERTKLRNELFGFVFSSPSLLPAFSVAENVAMPLFRIRGVDPAAAQLRTLEALDFCGIADTGDVLAGRLDGELAAVAALARALVHGPRILVVVSPRCGRAILPLGRRAAEELGVCVLWAGEPPALAQCAHRILEIRDGQIAGEAAPV